MKARGAAAAIAALILALYGRTLGYGLVWDDFAALRHRPVSALAGAWTGAWDPGGVWPDFYRPLSIALYDAMFRLFGHNAPWLHAVNLAELFLAAWLLRAFVRRETASDTLGFVAGVLLIAHPETPTSLAAWISQQFHLVGLLWVLTAALLWQRARHRDAGSWSLVLLTITAGALMKEDIVLVAPALVVWQMIRARTVGDVARPTRPVVTLVVVWLIAYGCVRTLALHALGGYQLKSVARVLLNLIDGPILSFGMQWIPEAHEISVITGIGVAAWLLLAWRLRHTAAPQLTALAQYGVSLAAFANLPLALASSHTRMYLMDTGAVLTLTAAAGIVVGGRASLTPRVWKRLVIVTVIAAIAMTRANWVSTNAFAPCAGPTIDRNIEALSWEITGEEARREIHEGLRSCGTVAPRQ